MTHHTQSTPLCQCRTADTNILLPHPNSKPSSLGTPLNMMANIPYRRHDLREPESDMRDPFHLRLAVSIRLALPEAFCGGLLICV